MEIVTNMSQALQLHAQILKTGSPHSTTLDLTTLFTFSTFSGNLAYARLLLPTLQTHPPHSSYFHNILIRAYSGSRDPTQSLHLFLLMHRGSHLARPDNFTFPSLLKACSRIKHTLFGIQIHGLINKFGLGSDPYIQNSLIRFYCTCGNSKLAQKLFDEMPELDLVSWTSLIDGLVDDGRSLEALKVFGKMMRTIELKPSDVTMICVLRACGNAGSLSIGQGVHGFLKKTVYTSNVATAIIDMYAKCGRIENAKRVFKEARRKDLFIWTVMISGLACHGMCQDAITLFEEMRNQHINPDEKAMTAILSACRNVGWVHRGCDYFDNMKSRFGVQPTIQHYGIIVDMLGRAGRLKEAEEFISRMHLKPDDILWRSLISASKLNGDIERCGRLMKEHLMDFNVDCGSFVLMCNVFASIRRWEEKGNIRKLMDSKGLVKPPGWSRIEMSGMIHEFTAGDSSHPEAELIFEKMGEIEKRLKEEGYCPNLSQVLLDVDGDDDEMGCQLRHHSERLAVAFGLIRSREGFEIRVVKNLRSCEDCHSVLKLISKVYERRIVVRDRIRFHHFENGECSCKDYW